MKMVSEKDAQLLDYLLAGTNDGGIRWQPTATEHEFAVGLKGKYNVVVSRSRTNHWLRMEDDQERELLSLSSEDDGRGRVEAIFESARRVALNVDNAIDEIIGGE